MGLLCLLALTLFARSMSRLFDLDEHQFVSPALLLTEQGVSVLCGFLTALLLFETGWRSLRNLGVRTRWLLAGGVTLTFLCCRIFTYTYPSSWSHNTAVLAALAATLLFLRGLRDGKSWRFAAAGALLGAAVGLRLSFAFTVIPFAISLLTARSRLSFDQRKRAICLAAGAALLVLLPAFRLWWLFPDQFLFGNLQSPQFSTQMYVSVQQTHRISLFGKTWYMLQSFCTDPGNLMLLVWTAFVLAVQFVHRRQWRSAYANELWLMIGLLPMLAIGAYGPSPMFYQYLYMLAPFMVLTVFYSMAADQNLQHIVNRWKRAVALGLLLAAGTGLPRWYHDVVNVPLPDRWTPVLTHNVGVWIREQVPVGGRVLTIDPLFAQEVGLGVYPEFGVGRFIMLVGRLLTPDNRETLRRGVG